MSVQDYWQTCGCMNSGLALRAAALLALSEGCCTPLPLVMLLEVSAFATPDAFPTVVVRLRPFSLREIWKLILPPPVLPAARWRHMCEAHGRRREWDDPLWRAQGTLGGHDARGPPCTIVSGPVPRQPMSFFLICLGGEIFIKVFDSVFKKKKCLRTQLSFGRVSGHDLGLQ